jgi:hypothetical protein
MTDMEPGDRMESIASGVEPFSLGSAADALAEAERRAQAEAAGAEPARQPLSKRLLKLLLGR